MSTTTLSSEKIKVEFFVEGLPPSPNQTKGLHWTKLEKIKKEWVANVATPALAAKVQERLKGLYDQCEIHFQISVGDQRRHDPDNLLFSVAKPTLDALQGILISDDNIDCIKLSFGFDRNKPRGYRVTIVGK